ncbi:two-component system sensor histidine kinase PilS (NtrC family) [Pseudacidovorax intermedius]|uniref:histidine kinase n=1 Tax=Pseudacidovorax intermedius TaxID=433924 RepID=A0A370FKT2_9BURK|nr:ATP-binding protein [Pseudacidovorax intermedius]RDI28307.1 two-component system sensor histidine kinase PilS (NtrC family) [Pseudacidovorax intermedius]
MTPDTDFPSSNTDWSALETRTERSQALQRIWRGFMTARPAVGLLLLALQGIAFALGQSTHAPTLAITALYAAFTLADRLRTPARLPLRRLGMTWLLCIGLDVGVFALLQALQTGTTVNYTPLLALPVLMAAVAGGLVVGLATTSAATLLMLAEALRFQLAAGPDGPGRLLQAALTGTGLFVLSLLAHQLALRLAREEARASRSQDSAQLQAQINALVIEALAEGVLVVDEAGRVHTANPAADALLGGGLDRGSLPRSLMAHPAWQPLAGLAQRTFEDRADLGADLPIAQPQATPRELRVRTRLTAVDGARDRGFCVMFLQDLRQLEARIRTEKMAAMGRMSAAVAHEIRNPLAAITQASALLEEDLTEPAQQRLNAMVQQNARRLGRIVDEVLDVARVRQQGSDLGQGTALPLAASVYTMVDEWSRQSGRAQPALRLVESLPAVRFNEEHLRRILVNLLDNAARYAGPGEESIRVHTFAAGDGRPTLAVWSDGAPLEQGVERHLFEPFFSSESRSSGLGLFICRELCERHGATIRYERLRPAPDVPAGNAFLLSFAPAQAGALPQ